MIHNRTECVSVHTARRIVPNLVEILVSASSVSDGVILTRSGLTGVSGMNP